MCAVSMITDHYRDKWPLGDNPFTPLTKTITLQEWLEYLELKQKMAEYDARTNQPDCVKPEVADWEAAIVKVLKEKGIL
jgi:hypothetical protein